MLELSGDILMVFWVAVYIAISMGLYLFLNYNRSYSTNKNAPMFVFKDSIREIAVQNFICTLTGFICATVITLTPLWIVFLFVSVLMLISFLFAIMLRYIHRSIREFRQK
jgi:hypothetical protein